MTVQKQSVSIIILLMESRDVMLTPGTAKWVTCHGSLGTKVSDFFSHKFTSQYGGKGSNRLWYG